MVIIAGGIDLSIGSIICVTAVTTSYLAMYGGFGIGAAVAIAAFGALYLFINRTDFGRALEATREDAGAVALVGIDKNRVFALGWGLGAALVGLAGAVMAIFFYIYPDVGASFALIAYVTVALGGFGSVFGAFRGAVETASGVRGSLLLRTHLVELYHDAVASPGAARVTLTAELTDPAGRNLLAQRSFSASVPVVTYDAAGAVQGFGQALGQLLDEVAAWAAQAAAGARAG